VFSNEEAAPLALRQKIGSRQEVSGDGLRVASAEASSRNKVVIRSKHRELSYSGRSAQFIEHEPGPRGSPQLPHGLGDDEKLFCEPPTAKLESCWSRLWLEHDGQVGSSEPRTTASKWRSHSLQMYSKIGIKKSGYRG